MIATSASLGWQMELSPSLDMIRTTLISLFSTNSKLMASSITGYSLCILTIKKTAQSSYSEAMMRNISKKEKR
jgi:hypothetical protein